MNTVYARALVALALVALPASAFASTRHEAKAHKAKHETKGELVKPNHGRASVARKEPSTKKSKHPGHKAKDGKALTAESGLKAKAR